MKTVISKPKMVQMFDVVKDREYYKVNPGFFGTYHTLLKTDRIAEYIHLEIITEKMPDKITFNGEEYKLIKVK